MDAKKIFQNIKESFIYMERYVNNGSPSGWTKKRTTSKETNPFTGMKNFPLIQFDDTNFDSIIIGTQNSIFNGVNFCHPDSIKFNSQIIDTSKFSIQDSEILVEPTSGGRTMFVSNDKYSGFIKLTYDVSRLGRVDRQLKFEHCMSSYEVSNTIKRAIDSGKFESTYSILLERTGKVTYIPTRNGFYEWGVMLREFNPYPYQYERTLLVPGFSLFGTDFYSRETENDELLINQFILLSGIEPRKYLMNILIMTIDAWFQTLINCALILELHGQNCYYEIDEKFNIRRIVIKDMDSVDKDITLAKKFGLNTIWKSFPYECFYEDEPENHPWYYKIRPSYMYDFKLSTYLLLPIINAVCEKFNLDEYDIRREIKEYVNSRYIPLIPIGYFPEDGTWYDCDDSERKPGERRKYFSHSNPLFR